MEAVKLVCGTFPLSLLSEEDSGGRPVSPSAESCSFSCRPHIYILNGFLWQLGIFMAPFGSMGFAADGGVEMGGVVSSDGGRGTLQIQNRMGDMAPSGDFTLCVWSLFLIFGRFGSFCVFLQLSSHGVGLRFLHTGIQNFSLRERGSRF